jgi:hypothetical protein
MHELKSQGTKASLFLYHQALLLDCRPPREPPVPLRMPTAGYRSIESVGYLVAKAQKFFDRIPSVRKETSKLPFVSF